MNARFLAAFLCLATLSGCIIHDHHDDDCCTTPVPSQPGDVSFLWTFQNKQCNDVRAVKGVNIRIPGETLSNAGRYDCTTGGIDGITLHDFAPGSYRFEIDAVDYQNTVLYTGSGTFTVNGDVRVSIDLMPTGAAPSYALVSWLFPNNASCFQVGATRVKATIDGELSKDVDCTAGNGGAAIETPNLQPGTHSIEISAFSSTGQRLYFTRGTFTTQANNPLAHQYSLSPVGTLTLNWAFSRDGGATTLGCSDVGVSELSIDLQDSNGNWVFGGVGTSGPCVPPTGSFETLAPGRYRVSMYGKDANNVFYRSSDSLYVDVATFQTRTVNVLLMRTSTSP